MASDRFLIGLYDELLKSLAKTPLESWRDSLPALIEKGLDSKRWGDLPTWQAALEQLPQLVNSRAYYSDTISINGECDSITENTIETLLRQLIPWRKGPFRINELFIDTEWRSDWKWQRVLPHIAPLTNRLVLDVGCGNGYHCWRMLEAKAKQVIGIDPSPRFVMQFYAIKHFIGSAPVDVLPLALEDLPDFIPAFDSVFSMGVLYHRPGPMDHLRQLRSLLRKRGQLILETLVIDHDDQLPCHLSQVLVPEKRYAMMNNVWFIPSPNTLCDWLIKCGFENPQVVDINTTSIEEQRVTDWMQYHSLENFLDPNDHTLTIEGYPAPKRAIVIADAK